MRPYAALLLALLASTARAQEITGTVRSQNDRAPLPGAIVILVQTDGVRAGATLTDDAGRYRLRARQAGSFALRVDVVGYQSLTIPAFPVDSGAAITRDILFPFERTRLPAVTVTAASSCARVEGETGDAPRLWGEARKMLEASRLAQDEQRFKVALRRFERTVGLPDMVLRGSRVWTQTGVSENPFETLAPDVIARNGYRVQQGTDLLYYGPDARVLLSDEFVSAHCFGTRRGGPDGAVGLTFRPQRLQQRIDISGVLWLDSASAELRSLEYRYVPGVGPQDVGGGLVAFGKYPSGVWGVQSWTIRLPVLQIHESRFRPDGALGRHVDTLVVAMREVGGEVLAGNVPVAAADMQLRGVVFDSTLGKPLPGARVTIEGLGLTTETGADGRFAFDSLADPGEVRVRVWHPRLDSLGLSAPVERVQLRRRTESTVAFRLPGVGDVAAARCGRESRDAARVVLGVLRSHTDSVRAATEVILLERLTGNADSLVRHVAITSDGGRYAFCNVQPGSQAWILARSSATGFTQPRHIPADSAPAVDVHPLQLPLPELDSADAPAVVLGRTLSPYRTRIEGWVLQPEHGEAAIQVLVDNVPRAQTRADGSFSMPNVPTGVRRLSFRGQGLAQRNVAVTVTSGESQLLVVALRPAPLVVVKVEAPPPDPLAAFRYRKKMGGGSFIERADIERRNAKTLTDLLRTVPGVRVMIGVSGMRYVSSHFRRLSQGNSQEAGLCDMMIYIDGQPFQGAASAAESRVRAEDIAAMEVYTSAGSVPREFAGRDAACGVIVIWLK